jgi:hypothetical protein
MAARLLQIFQVTGSKEFLKESGTGMLNRGV